MMQVDLDQYRVDKYLIERSLNYHERIDSGFQKDELDSKV